VWSQMFIICGFFDSAIITGPVDRWCKGGPGLNFSALSQVFLFQPTEMFDSPVGVVSPRLKAWKVSTFAAK
ncbi:hypothetical protein ACFL9U_10790, partial [Thermodesulfobacteriota bacterium]